MTTHLLGARVILSMRNVQRECTLGTPVYREQACCMHGYRFDVGINVCMYGEMLFELSVAATTVLAV